MKLSPLFRLREEATPALLELLSSVTLGTNGAHYRHLDTEHRIHEADNPLHLSLERRERVMGNVTFCRREKTWYVRYFAFINELQGKGQVKSRGQSGRLKKELQVFFDNVLSEDMPFGDIRSFYAYIDPNNEKSLWMSENFGFEKAAEIATQSFSRIRLPKRTAVEKIDDWHLVSAVIRSHFAKDAFYFEDHLKKGPYFVIRDASGTIQACAKITTAKWAIDRLPGKIGGWLPKIIPFIPGLRKIIRPKNHTFLVPEAVFVANDDPKILVQLFEGMLALENQHLILWWVDQKTPLYKTVQKDVRWGLLHQLIGVNKAHLVVKNNSRYKQDNSSPVYTCGFDFV